MFKKAAQQARIITEHFACVGLGTGQVGDVWVVSAGVQMPPALEQNSEEYAGAIPPNAILFDEAGLKAYIRDNTPRPEPAGTVWLTEADICRQHGLSARQFAAAKASGFPKANGRRDYKDAEENPTHYENAWTSDVVRNWFELRGLVVAGR